MLKRHRNNKLIRYTAAQLAASPDWARKYFAARAVKGKRVKYNNVHTLIDGAVVLVANGVKDRPYLRPAPGMQFVLLEK
jgi:hypothetical protein